MGGLLGGLALLATLIPVERRATVPVLPLRLFRHRTYTALLTAGFFFQVAALPVGIFLPLYFQHIRGHSATTSGLLLLPLLIGMALGNRLTAATVLRSGHVKPVLLIGTGLLAAGTAAFMALRTTAPPALTSVLLLPIGLGAGPAMGGLAIATQNAVPSTDMGTATAGSALTKQIGGAVGLACAQSLIGHSGTAAPTATAIGPTVARSGGVAGLLALRALLLMRDIPIATAGKRPGAPTPPSPVPSKADRRA
ncbi:MFS transporter [Streptomyces sp. HNM1019]|uniref:MFS transporter n=1 Tax=Streptomyces sp. HNM1019 TaxID=3424717 RepID=UPI003D76DA3E